MTHNITALETTMLNLGFASTRIVAAKLKRSQSTILRLLREGRLAFQTVNGQKFVSVQAVKVFAGSEGVEALDLADWSNAL